MKVALFTDSDVFAGTERHMLDLAGGLRRLGVDARIACPMPSPLAERAVVSGIGVIAIAKRGMVDWQAARILRRMFRFGELDIVHTHNGRTALAAALSIRGTQGVCVATQHFLTPDHATKQGIKGKIFKKAHLWVNGKMRALIAISRAARDGILERGEAPADRVVVVPNGIPAPDMSRAASPEGVRGELGIDAGAPLVMCAARLEKEKDIGTLIAAMKIVAARKPAAVCLIAGEGIERDALAGRIVSEKLENNVRLLGFRNDVPALMNASDVFVLPSLAEPFGLVLLEAMSLGKPVIATAAGGPLEIVENGKTGLLVKPSDAPELAGALLQLLESSSSSARQMGEAGRARYQELFTADRMARDILAVYGKALEPKLKVRTAAAGEPQQGSGRDPAKHLQAARSPVELKPDAKAAPEVI